MPLRAGASNTIVSANIREMHSGKTYAHTRAKFGKRRADRQAVAIALAEKRKTIVKGRRA
jgi:hypothetical protein